MNDISIIINGVRYDAIKSKELHSCKGCEMSIVQACGLCTEKTIFKKSTKSFEI